MRAICADSGLEFAISQSISVVPCVFGKPPIVDERLFPNAIRVFGWGHLVDNANQAGLSRIAFVHIGNATLGFLCRLRTTAAIEWYYRGVLAKQACRLVAIQFIDFMDLSPSGVGNR